MNGLKSLLTAQGGRPGKASAMAVLNTTLAARNARGHDRYINSLKTFRSRKNKDELNVGISGEGELGLI
jgi:hypothetical protein